MMRAAAVANDRVDPERFAERIEEAIGRTPGLHRGPPMRQIVETYFVRIEGRTPENARLLADVYMAFARASVCAEIADVFGIP